MTETPEQSAQSGIKSKKIKVVIDERETSLYDKCRALLEQSPKVYNLQNIEITKTTLHIGDIHILTDDGKDVVIIERKALKDLLSSIKDGRYDEQSHRLIHSSGVHPHNIIYLIEGGLLTLSVDKRKLVHSVITSLNHFKGMTVIKTANVAESAEFVLSFADKVARNFSKKMMPKYWSVPLQPTPQPAPQPTPQTIPETLLSESNDSIECSFKESEEGNNSIECSFKETPLEQVNEHNYVSVVKKVKKDNLTPNNIGAVFLSQIPLVSSVIANAIMMKYQHSMTLLIKELEKDPDCLNAIQTEKDGKKRKIGSNVVKNIRLFLLGDKVEG
jgi:hypothetical protein